MCEHVYVVSILTDGKGLWIWDTKENVHGMPSAQLQVSLYSDQFISVIGLKQLLLLTGVHILPLLLSLSLIIILFQAVIFFRIRKKMNSKFLLR